MLHGLPQEYAWVGTAQTLPDWTDGCIAVSNDEMDEIWRLVRVGIPIEIKPCPVKFLVRMFRIVPEAFAIGRSACAKTPAAHRC
jgi:hypothetical protein